MIILRLQIIYARVLLLMWPMGAQCRQDASKIYNEQNKNTKQASKSRKLKSWIQSLTSPMLKFESKYALLIIIAFSMGVLNGFFC